MVESTTPVKSDQTEQIDSNKSQITTNQDINPERMVNINIGVLGHIDSGKTSLCKALSTIMSTAGADKSPQSQERGITLDLGFSAFVVPVPDWVRDKNQQKLDNIDFIQFTLVDCPGHASLMKTVIGGASIIDLMILVVDCQKLIQTQTAECIVLGEILMDKLICAFNKIDMLTDEKVHEAQLKKIKMQLGNTKFGKNNALTIVETMAVPSSEDKIGRSKETVQNLINTILEQVEIPDRARGAEKPFLFAIDHCFPIKGKGTVITGTVLAGKVKVGDTIELPMLKLDRKVKSIQMFRKPVKQIIQGDRAGMCVPDLKAELIERGIAAAPRTVKHSDLVIVMVKRIPYFTAGELKTKGKFHVSLGHQTVIAEATFFSQKIESQESDLVFNKNALKAVDSVLQFDLKAEYQAEDILPKIIRQRPKQTQQNKEQEESKEETKKQFQQDQQQSDQPKQFFAILKLEQATMCSEQNLLIGSKLDVDTAMKTCRLCFYGQVLCALPFNQTPEERTAFLSQMTITKDKLKVGIVDKVVDPTQIHMRDLFSKETSPDLFVGLKVVLKLTQQEGQIIGTFGKSGKLKVKFDEPLQMYSQLVGTEVELRYKKNMMKKKANKFK